MKRRDPQKRALANEISAAIRLGDFRAGEWLRQIDLEHRFGATRFDVRSALEELSLRKAIQHIPNRGYRIAIMDDDTIRTIREVRTILESAAAPRIVSKSDVAATIKLREIAKRFTEAVESGSHLDHSRINREFHEALYALCDNPVLEEMIWSLRERSRGAALTVWKSHRALLQSAKDHHDIVAAIEKRDPAGLAELIVGHIDLDRK